MRSFRGVSRRDNRSDANPACFRSILARLVYVAVRLSGARRGAANVKGPAIKFPRARGRYGRGGRTPHTAAPVTYVCFRSPITRRDREAVQIPSGFAPRGREGGLTGPPLPPSRPYLLIFESRGSLVSEKSSRR